MPWIGLESSCSSEGVESLLKEYGYTVARKFAIELFVKESWMKFIIYEVIGFAEGVAELLSETFNCPALEAGPHLVLGEVSAKLWDEAAKVVMPTGESYIVPIYTYDGFLDVKMPTSKVRGLKGQIIIGGRAFDLPLKEEDILNLMIIDKRVKEKIEKAIAVYGEKRILSEELRERLGKKTRDEGRKSTRIEYEIDPETKIVFCLYDGKLTSMSLSRFTVFLAENQMFDELKEFLNKLPPSQLREIYNTLKEYLEVYKSTAGSRTELKNILEDLEKKLK
ncbi:hypothetical protein MA03_00240 [Infirmifilum uzonense]|uniref:Uncharacterized protein n=1 Tax=Infirmifilum uzonense TaxID=1550241 RepID=A0A0F7FFT9_9CREN|nr:hypothetical protein [Infirmifilum uzonense]AKG38030.1 hypothetical protein MA03_00240 [Infirmifilum uzonense]